MVQVTQAKNTLDIVAQKLKGHEMEDGFAKALLALSTEEFAD